MTNDRTIIVSKNYEGTVRKSWDCRLLKQDENELVFVGEFEHDVVHAELGFIKRGTVSYEYYWLDRWYNVFRFHEPNGELRNFYCNVNMPPIFTGGRLEYVDLDLDLLVLPDRSYSVLDRDEFETNSRLFNYPESVKNNAEKALAELIQLSRTDRLPHN